MSVQKDRLLLPTPSQAQEEEEKKSLNILWNVQMIFSPCKSQIFLMRGGAWGVSFGIFVADLHAGTYQGAEKQACEGADWVKMWNPLQPTAGSQHSATVFM